MKTILPALVLIVAIAYVAATGSVGEGLPARQDHGEDSAAHPTVSFTLNFLLRRYFAPMYLLHLAYI